MMNRTNARNTYGTRNRQNQAQGPARKKPSSSVHTANRPTSVKSSRYESAETGILMSLFSRFYYALRKKLSPFQIILLLSAVLYLLFLGIYCGIRIHKIYQVSEKLPTVTYITNRKGNLTKTDTVSVSGKEAFRGSDTPYINLTKIAEEAEMMTIGNYKQIRLITGDGSGQSALFVADNCHVVIGDTTVSLSSPVRIINRTVYVPYEFFVHYVGGYEVSYSTVDHELKVIRSINESESTEKKVVYQPTVFLLTEKEECPAIAMPIETNEGG